MATSHTGVCIYTCDRCGGTQETAVFGGRPKEWHTVWAEAVSEAVFGTQHVCPNCTESLRKWFRRKD